MLPTGVYSISPTSADPYLTPISNGRFNVQRRNLTLPYTEYATNSNIAMYCNPTSKLYDPLRAVSILQTMFPDELEIEELEMSSEGCVVNDSGDDKKIEKECKYSKPPKYTKISSSKWCKNTKSGITLG
jgi:hypothetical protein